MPGWQAALLFAAALALLALYRPAHADRYAEPIIRPALFADAAFTVPNVMNVLANLAGFTILLLTPYYLVNVLGLSALASGVVLALAFVGGLAGRAAGGAAGAAHRPAPDRLCRHCVVGFWPPAARPDRGIDTPVAVVAALLLVAKASVKACCGRLHRPRDRHPAARATAASPAACPC